MSACSALSKKETEQMNECMHEASFDVCMKEMQCCLRFLPLIIPLNIGNYTAENGPAC